VFNLDLPMLHCCAMPSHIAQSVLNTLGKSIPPRKQVRALSWRRNDTKLLHHAQLVKVRPVFHQLAALNSNDIYPLAHSQQSSSGAHQTKFVAFHCAVSPATNLKLRLYRSLFLSFGTASTSDCLISAALDGADVGNGPIRTSRRGVMSLTRSAAVGRCPLRAWRFRSRARSRSE
jgi:hypothetical protein